MAEVRKAYGGAFLIDAGCPDSVFIPEEFGPDARLMAKTADDFLRKEVLPHVESIETGAHPLMRELLEKAGELGLLGADVPEAYGGLGLDLRTGALLAEKINWQQSFALTHEAHTALACNVVLFFGNDDQKRRYLPKLARGEWIGAFALSEAGSGSNALGAQTRATLSPDGRYYVLNGAKMWITNAGFADLFTLFAKVDGEKFTCFLVERTFPGISFGKEEHKLGMHGTSTRRVVLENVPVPTENVVGEIGKGHYAAFCALNMGRFKLEAGAVGGLKETLAICAAYANQRKQFGRTIGEFGLIQAKIGEMAARTFALESAVYRLAGLMDGAFAGIDADAEDAPDRYRRAAEGFAVECSIVKVVGSELYSWATDQGIQIHGGYGYTEEFPMARAWRDQRLLRIGEGANEVVRLAIVKELLRRAASGRLPLASATEFALSLDLSDSANLAELRGEGGRTPRALAVAALLLLDEARAAFGDTLMDEQEVAAGLADVISAAFVTESAWLRADKMAASGAGKSSAVLAQDAAALYAELACKDCRDLANLIRSRIRHLDAYAGAVESNGSPELLASAPVASRSSKPTPKPGSDRAGAGIANVDALLTFCATDDRDVIGLQRILAHAILEKEAYPW